MSHTSSMGLLLLESRHHGVRKSKKPMERPPQGERLRVVAHSAGVAPVRSQHQLASMRVVKVDDPAAGELLQLMPHGAAKSHPH